MKYLVMILVGLMLYGCDRDDAEAVEPEPETRRVPVEVAVAATRNLQETIVTTTTVDSRRAVDIVAEVPGILVDIDVEQGDVVRRGQRLARIQRAELELGLDTANSMVRRLENEVKRLEPLLEQGVISRQMMDEATWRLDEARTEQRRARTAHSDQRITSPMDGVVALRYPDPGQQVAMGTPVFRVVDPEELIVDVHLPESSLARVFDGQRAYIESDALAGQRFPGAIDRISPVVDPRTGTVRVTIGVEKRAIKAGEESDGEKGAYVAKLRPGMFVRAFIVTSERTDVLAIPRRAVRYVDDVPTVFLVKDGVAMRRTVVTGVIDGTFIEITEGLQAQDQVVILGHDGLRDGTPVVPEIRERT